MGGKFTEHPLIRRVDTALKKFKAQLTRATATNMHSFLESRVQDAVRDLSSTDDSCIYYESSLSYSFWKAVDSTLRFVIFQLKKMHSPERLTDALNVTFLGRSLVAKAAELNLPRSLALLLACGASLGRDLTPKDILAGMENNIALSRQSLPRLQGEKERDKIRALLDRNAIFEASDEEYYTIQIHRPNETETRIANSNSLLQIRSKYNGSAPWSDRMAWVHASSTNVGSYLCVSYGLVTLLTASGTSYRGTVLLCSSLLCL
jgi:hypothetical protein